VRFSIDVGCDALYNIILFGNGIGPARKILKGEEPMITQTEEFLCGVVAGVVGTVLIRESIKSLLTFIDDLDPNYCCEIKSFLFWSVLIVVDTIGVAFAIYGGSQMR
jgi:hypothetical protein